MELLDLFATSILFLCLAWLILMIIFQVIASKNFSSIKRFLAEKPNEESIAKNIQKSKKTYSFAMHAFSIQYVLIVPLGIIIYLILSVYMLHLSNISPYFGLIGLFLFAGAVITIISIVRSFYAIPEGQTISREELPELWALSDELAQTLNTEPINRIILFRDTEMAVREAVIRISKKEKKAIRELHIGLASLSGLNLMHLASILAHEYGHFLNGDTNAMRFVYKMIYSLQNLLDIHVSAGLDFKINPVFWFLKYFRFVFLNYFRGYSQLNEYLADTTAINTFGSNNFILALERFINISAIYNTIINRAFDNFYNSTYKKSIDSPYRSQFYLRSLNEEEENSLKDELIRKSKMGDTHPSFNERSEFSNLLAKRDYNQYEESYIKVENIEQVFIKDLTVMAQTHR